MAERYRVVSVVFMDVLGDNPWFDKPGVIWAVEDTQREGDASIIAAHTLELKAIGHAARLNYYANSTSTHKGE